MSFESLWIGILKIILPRVLRSKYVGGYLEFDADAEFVDTVKKLCGLTITITNGYLNHNFPPLYKTTVKTKVLDFTVTAGSTEATTLHGKRIGDLKAKGEFLERLSGSMPLDDVNLQTKDADALQMLRNTKLYAKRLCSFGYKGIDAAYVYYQLSRISHSIKKLTIQPTTNGGAGHFDYRSAVLNALLEAIQRDAFLVHWLNSIPPQKIDIDSYLCNQNRNSDTFNELKQLVDNFKKYKLQYYFLDITSDIQVPAVCCALIMDSPTGKRVTLGASAGFDTDSTLLSSATEATANASFGYSRKLYTLDQEYVPFTDPKLGRDERLSLYATDSMYEKIEFFFSSDRFVSVDAWATVHGYLEKCGYTSTQLSEYPKKALKYLKVLFSEKRVKNPAYEVVVYEIKNKLLKHFGYRFVKVFCNALYSLYLNENYADPTHPRLQEFVKNKKLEHIAKLNTWPHPFP